MEAEREQDLVKQLALAALCVVAIFWGYQAVTQLLKASAEHDARSLANQSLPHEGLRFGRFADFGHGRSCLEFAVIQSNTTVRYGAVVINGEDENEANQAVRQTLPSYEECLIRTAG